MSIPGTLQQHGVAERKNRTLLDMVRSMIAQANLPISYQGDALMIAATFLTECLQSRFLPLHMIYETVKGLIYKVYAHEDRLDMFRILLISMGNNVLELLYVFLLDIQSSLKAMLYMMNTSMGE